MVSIAPSCGMRSIGCSSPHELGVETPAAFQVRAPATAKEADFEDHVAGRFDAAAPLTGTSL